MAQKEDTTLTNLTQPENTYWHFLPKSRRLQYGDGREVVAGETLRVEGTPVLYEHGLHASARAIDALIRRPGPIACLVTLGGEVVHDADKSAGQERTCLWMIDATHLLREFACEVAWVALLREREAGREPYPRSWAAIKVTRRFLRGEASEAERKAAWTAALAAADDADKSLNDEYLNFSAASMAAYAAAYAAASTATYAAAYAAAWAADSAATLRFNAEAGAAATAEFNVRLTQMLLAAGQASQKEVA